MTPLASEVVRDTLVLRGSLTFETAREGHRALKAAVERGGQLRVDLFGIEDLDLAGVQVLLAARRHAAERQIELLWSGFSSPVEEMVRLLELEEDVGRPAAVMWGA